MGLQVLELELNAAIRLCTQAAVASPATSNSCWKGANFSSSMLRCVAASCALLISSLARLIMHNERPELFHQAPATE